MGHFCFGVHNFLKKFVLHLTHICQITPNGIEAFPSLEEYIAQAMNNLPDNIHTMIKGNQTASRRPTLSFYRFVGVAQLFAFHLFFFLQRNFSEASLKGSNKKQSKENDICQSGAWLLSRFLFVL